MNIPTRIFIIEPEEGVQLSQVVRKADITLSLIFCFKSDWKAREFCRENNVIEPVVKNVERDALISHLAWPYVEKYTDAETKAEKTMRVITGLLYSNMPQTEAYFHVQNGMVEKPQIIDLLGNDLRSNL
jgi:hypothetical protein